MSTSFPANSEPAQTTLTERNKVQPEGCFIDEHELYSGHNMHKSTFQFDL